MAVYATVGLSCISNCRPYSLMATSEQVAAFKSHRGTYSRYYVGKVKKHSAQFVSTIKYE